MTNYVVREIPSNRLVRVGTIHGKPLPVNSVSEEFIEVNQVAYTAARDAQDQGVAELREATVDNTGAVSLGPAPVDVMEIDYDGPTILKSGDIGTITFQRLGKGSLTFTINGAQVKVDDGSDKFDIVIAVA